MQDIMIMRILKTEEKVTRESVEVKKREPYTNLYQDIQIKPSRHASRDPTKQINVLVSKFKMKAK